MLRIGTAVRSPRLLALVTVAVLAGGFAAARTPGTVAPALDPARVAVLEFNDLSATASLHHISRGLAENLARRLAETRAIEVVSPNAVRALSERHVSMDSLVHALHPGSLVEGSVDQSNGRIRVDVRLVDGRTQAEVAATRVERPVAEQFMLQDDIARRVALLLTSRIGAQVAVRNAERGTVSSAARELTYRGEQAFEDAGAPDAGDLEQSRRTTAALRLADSLFAEASRADPAWVMPRIRRGWVLVELARGSTGTVEQALFGRALAQADSVLRLDSSKVSARELRGAVRYWMVARGVAPQGSSDRVREEARQDLLAATRSGTARPASWGLLSLILAGQGRVGEADSVARRALELDAYLRDGPIIIFSLFASAGRLADFPRAREWCARGARDYPLQRWFVDCELTLMAEDPRRQADPVAARALVARGDLLDPPAKAIAAGRAYSVAYRQMMEAIVWARAGNPDSARAVSARARLLTLQDTTVAVDYLYDLAYLQLTLGDRQGAAKTLREFVRRRPALTGLVGSHRRWDAIREQLVLPR